MWSNNITDNIKQHIFFQDHGYKGAYQIIYMYIRGCLKETTLPLVEVIFILKGFIFLLESFQYRKIHLKHSKKKLYIVQIFRK